MTRLIHSTGVSLLVTLVLFAGCKPESEPDCPYGPCPGTFPDVSSVPSPQAGNPSDNSDEDVSPVESPGDVVDFADTVEAAEVVSETEAFVLSEERRMALRRPVSAAERELAQHKVQSARELMELRPDQALVDLEEALAVMPSHAEANLLAACAYVQRGDERQGLIRLLALRELGDGPARAALQAARRESDLRPLHAHPLFRELTGFGVVGVAVRHSGHTRRQVRKMRAGLIATVERAGLGARRREPPKANLGAGSLVLHRPGLGELALEVASAFGGGIAVREVSIRILDDALVLWDPSDALPTGRVTNLDDLLEIQLQSQDTEGMYTFRLRPRNFFESSEQFVSGDVVVRRSGTYVREGETIRLTYQETKTVRSEHSDVPTIEKTKGDLRLSLKVGPGKRLVLGGRTYEP